MGEQRQQANPLLEALEYFRDLDALISLNSIITFLHLCRHEGVSMKELAFLARMTEATASRSVRTLEAPDASTALPPAMGLVEIVRSAHDARSRLIFLSDKGRYVSDHLDTIVRAGKRVELHANRQTP